MLCKLMTFFSMKVPLTLYGPRAIRKTGKTQKKKKKKKKKKIGQKSFTIIVSTKSKHLFSHVWTAKNICDQIAVLCLVNQCPHS